MLRKYFDGHYSISTLPSLCFRIISCTINSNFDRLIGYHRRRQEQCQQLLESYVDTHEKVARCLLKDRMNEIPSCYEDFFDEVDEFIQTQISFTDLIAPELVALEEKVRELIEKILEELKNELTPPWLIEFKQDLISKLVDEVATSLNLKLSDSEAEHVVQIVQTESTRRFSTSCKCHKSISSLSEWFNFDKRWFDEDNRCFEWNRSRKSCQYRYSVSTIQYQTLLRLRICMERIFL